MRAVDQYLLTPIPGQHVPKCVTRALGKLYPTVRIVWNYHHQKWQLIEKMKNGAWGDISIVDGNPTIENTIGLLAEIDSAQLQSEADIDRFLERLDADREAAQQKRILRLQESSRQIGEAVFDSLRGKIQVTPWQRSSRRR